MGTRQRARGRPAGRWARGRPLRHLAPSRLAQADLALFRRVARTRPSALDAVLPRLAVAADHSKLWAATAALLAARGGSVGRRAALRGLGSVAVTSALANLPGKLLVGRTRPDHTVVPEVRRLARIPTSASLPSGHTASAAAFTTGVGLEWPAAAAPVGLLAGGVACSRVYTGVHYPGDVLAGALLGTGVALASRGVWPVTDRTPARGSSAPPGPRPGPDGEGLVVVCNSQAGQALLAAPAERLVAALPAAEIVDVDTPAQLRDALDHAAARARAVGIAGGDGSVGAAAARAHAAGLPLVVVPGGTLNRFATDLGVHDVEDAAAAVRDGQAVAMDVAEIVGADGAHAFVNAVALGLYPPVVDLRERLQGRVGKWPAMLLAFAWMLVSGRPLAVELDGCPYRLWHLFVGNGRLPAPGLAPRHRRRLDEGVFDVRLVRADRRLARTRLGLAALLGRLHRAASYESRTAEQLTVRSPHPLRVAGDGETFTAPAELTIRKRPEPLTLLVPPDAPR